MDFKPFKIGKYLLLERIAIGGMAELYRAKASGAGGFEKQLAIKRILPTYCANEEFRRMFEYEARLSSQLTQANIVQIYDFVKSGDTYLLAMEYVHGKNLRQFLNKVKKLQLELPIAFGIYVINEVCKGLDYAHNKKDELTHSPLKIIHRDMSPQNIMLSYDGAVKIVDFGIAKAKDRVDETRSGVIKGKFGYMSPEQANGEEVDHRTDIFSTTIILYELLTGKRLFTADNDMATLRRIQECVIGRPSLVNPKISEDLEKIVLKGLAKDLSLRFQDAGSFHKNLQEYLNKHFPTYRQSDVAETTQKAFADEMEIEKNRVERAYRQTIPFSQGVAQEEADSMSEIEKLLDGETTTPDALEQTLVTDTEEGSISEEENQDLVLGERKEEKEPPSDLLLDPAKETWVEETTSENPSAPTEPMEEVPLRTVERTIEHTESEMSVLKQLSSGVTENTEEITVHESEQPALPSPSLQPPSGSGISLSDKDINLIHTAGPLRSKDPMISSWAHEGSPLILPPVDYIPPPRSSTRDPFLEDIYNHDAPIDDPAAGLRKTLLAVIVVFFFVGTVYLYRFYMGGRLVTVINQFRGRTITETGGREPKQLPSGVKPEEKFGECALNIVTEPTGAKIILNNVERGVAPAVLTMGCKRAVNLTLELSGYEPVAHNIVPGKNQKIFTRLTKIPVGTLELTVNFNSKVSVNGREYRDVKAYEVFKIALRSGGRHKIRFKNPVYGIDITKEYSVKEDSIRRESIHLEESFQRKPTKGS